MGEYIDDAELLSSAADPPVSSDLSVFTSGSRQETDGQSRDCRLEKKATVGELVLLSQDEARFPLVPTLRTTLGVKGSRPLVGTWDCKDLVYVVASVNVVQGNLTTRMVECAARIRAKTGKSKSRVLQEAFVRHLRDVARVYPAERYPRVVIMLDNAPWHRGRVVTEVLQDYPHLEFYRLPSYCPDLNPIERFWKILRRRASHNRLFETMKTLRVALRGSISYFQTYRERILSLMGGAKRPRRKSEKKLSAP